MLHRLDLREYRGNLKDVLPRPILDDEGPLKSVRDILERVKNEGDSAILDLTSKFDGVKLRSLRVPESEINGSLDEISNELRYALEEARESIVAFHEHSFITPGLYERKGIKVEHLSRPVSRAGLYAPGGRAKYPSSVLMCSLPARVAGVPSLVLCVPPDKDGRVSAPTLAAAAIAGIDEVYAIGGAQAIGAMAYGTESIEPVDVIVGPGNRYVSIAKRMVAGTVGVPSAFQGPSEVVVVADASVPSEWAAIDVIVQAEHGPDGLAWLITWQPEVADAVDSAIEMLVESAPRKNEIVATLNSGGYCVLVASKQEAMKVANEVAPEHLELLCEDAELMVGMVDSAGAVFVGNLACAAVGDYLAGPNHVLPTFRTAKFASALSVNDFLRHSHAVSISQEAINRVAPLIDEIALAEGLHAHSQAVKMRVSEVKELDPKSSSNPSKFKLRRG